MKRLFQILATLALGSFIPMMAADYVSVAKEGKVYDEANAKYITLNQNNDEVSVIPGMVFATSEHTPGWYKVEYSPGLHAFIPEQIVATSFTPIQAGTYEIKNNPGQKMTVNGNGNDWSATVAGKNYKGTKSQDVLVFMDDNNNVAFSLVDLGNGPIAISYENSLTKFF